MMMINENDFQRIDNEIKQCLLLALESIKKKSLSNYILLLANGEYQEILLRNKNLNPYTIEYPMDKYRDINRLSFLTNMLNTFYSFNNSNDVYDKEQIVHLELMTYSHIWESKAFLKKLYRIAHLLNGDPYNWTVEVPDKRKHDFIRNHITNILEENNSKLSYIIKKGFHSSLRNAFAHSEYYFDFISNLKTIELNNYKGKNWELKNITLNEWTERFVYSALLSYHSYSLLDGVKRNIVNEFGTNVFTIDRLSRDGLQIQKVKVEFRESMGEFNWHN